MDQIFQLKESFVFISKMFVLSKVLKDSIFAISDKNFLGLEVTKKVTEL